ncbi:MAG: argininosuccinate lyase [Patescibacteria group bacterium]
MKLWQKNYKLNEKIEEFTVGEDYILDQKLVKYDCLASIAHVQMLYKINILKKEETEKLIKALEEVIELDKKGKFIIKKQDEDCHTAIENYLTEKLGDIGKKIHTARSRTDQILTSLRLFYKVELTDIKKICLEFNKALEIFNKKYGSIKLPGYTHTRAAMPSSIEIWTCSFIDSMNDNLKLLGSVFELIDQNPLGSGPSYGVPINVDKELTAKLLYFKKVQKNPLYAHNSRTKFESSILHVLSQIMFDLNKISSDLILFSMSEFNFFILPDEFCTGSSIMPQKKNPDVLEILRAKYHVINSYEFQVKNINSNLISGYHREVQLTKKPMMEGFNITKQSLDIITFIFSKLSVDEKSCKKAMTNDIHAAEKVHELVRKGVPFREAYKIIGEKY